MDIFTTYDTSFQVLAAFVVFVVGYVALFLSLMICVLVAHWILEGVRVVRTHSAALPLRAIVDSSLEQKSVVRNKLSKGGFHASIRHRFFHV